ncbi:MAG: hypothetical protein COZ20_05360 [Gallionellales bacterium CG_4_10_14_3_um_filter_54_96]|nr:MAG: hypothetical protein COW45_06015 [Gallionellales bacterium CG17_big_fil_post_rev_8_21_14_2_50_54_146]PIX04114.1 MAG: hypothetical protein COZ77_08190 [Gallionellales bacterium CG_4_8_14_3_um_filter_54_18]PIY04546.1 MAG: hypothetical protein COZ20_05360 [Gallionellales bacterium CG_4_10_14_3_um_filter_54_96]
MVKVKTFITDNQWQRKQHQLLMQMASDPEQAKKLVRKMDENPDLRQGLWDVYCEAMNTIGLLD